MKQQKSILELLHLVPKEELADNAERERRKKQCDVCPFMKPNKGNPLGPSCGPAVLGSRVKHKGKFKRLCGCFVNEKRVFINLHCDLKKW